MLSLPDIEELARQTLSPMAYDYVASGAADELTIGWNRQAFDRIKLRPTVLQDASQVDMRVTLLGDELPHPILLAPTAYQSVVHPEGEVATARGAGAAGAPFVVSTATTAPLEEIARVATAPLWFQLYVQSDREFTTRLVRAAEEAGCRALCLTVDNPVLGARNRQARSGFRLPAGALTPYLDDLNNGRRDLFTAERVAVTWKDVEWLRSLSSMPVLLKGILTGSDARLAVESGAAGVIVSNHGGRNLDTLPATIEALPEVVAGVAGRLPVLVDGGIRRGTDVLKSIALGADAVLIGRPYLYGLGTGGAGGVQRVVDILRRELELAMTLCGRASLAALDHGTLWNPPADYFA
ncbi:MAG: alpha-hydroxy-acid oxidizing protein [Gemmatimonadetes bacterium]|nr:alpha-hydroxy-acid oxidizing protein [Gemmatimonadota bacterium]